jgi:hypothetical protein
VQDLLAEITRGGGGKGGVICKTVPFGVNRSSDQLQTQNQDSQYYSASLLLDKICISLTGGFWQASANLYNGGYKRETEPVASPQSTTLHSTVNTSVKEGRRPQQHTWNSKGLFFPAEILLHIVYIFNILCGLKVISSRRLQ